MTALASPSYAGLAVPEAKEAFAAHVRAAFDVLCGERGVEPAEAAALALKIAAGVGEAPCTTARLASWPALPRLHRCPRYAAPQQLQLRPFR
jgi:hypothetical protein